MSDDQAQHLRRLAEEARGTTPSPEASTASTVRARSSAPRTAHTLAVTGGKGGVGKTNLAVAIALCAARSGMRVGILDADFGLAKIHVLLGLSPRADLRDVLNGNARLVDTLIEGPEGIRVIPGASGLADIANMDVAQRDILLDELAAVSNQFDLLIVDTGAGIGENVVTFVVAADDAVIVTTPEPTAVADAYALIKVAAGRRPDLPIHLLINNATSAREASATAERISNVAERFLQVKINYSGSLPLDPAVGAAVRQRRSFLTHAPNSPASVALLAVADKILPSFGAAGATPTGGDRQTAAAPAGFASRLASLFGFRRG